MLLLKERCPIIPVDSAPLAERQQDQNAQNMVVTPTTASMSVGVCARHNYIILSMEDHDDEGGTDEGI